MLSTVTYIICNNIINMAHYNFISLGLILIFIIIAAIAEDNIPPQSEEESKSSSEETIEISSEGRRKRALEVPRSETEYKNGEVMTKAGIPGLPDISTILKIAEILQTLGEKVVPILVEGNSVANSLTEGVNKNLLFLKKFKQQIDSFAEEVKYKKK